MRTDGFWDLIDEARDSSGGDMERLAATIAARLRWLPSDEVGDFVRLWDAAMDAAYVWPLWDAAELWLGWLGDDSFRDFRGWLISRGRPVFERVVADPDNLAEYAADRDSPVADVWSSRFAELAGHRPDGSGPIVPSGDRIDVRTPAAVAARFPRLAALPVPPPPELPVVVGPPAEGTWQPAADGPSQGPLFARFRPRGGDRHDTAGSAQ